MIERQHYTEAEWKAAAQDWKRERERMDAQIAILQGQAAESAALRARVEEVELDARNNRVSFDNATAEIHRLNARVEEAERERDEMRLLFEVDPRDAAQDLAAAEESMTATQEQLRAVMLERNATVDRLTQERDGEQAHCAQLSTRLAAAEALLGRWDAAADEAKDLTFVPVHYDTRAFLARGEGK